MSYYGSHGLYFVLNVCYCVCENSVIWQGSGNEFLDLIIVENAFGFPIIEMQVFARLSLNLRFKTCENLRQVAFFQSSNS